METQSRYTKICAENIVVDLPSAAVVDQAKRLVNIKRHIDNFADSGSGGALSPVFQKMQGYGRTITPFTFALDLLPFYRYCRREQRDRVHGKYLVPTDMVIGESWKWTPELLSPERQDAVIQSTCRGFDESDGSRASRSCADYVYLKPLGLVIAHEGKNRVELFRSKGYVYIPAFVSEESYFDPSRIEIFKLHDITLAVLDSQKVERVNGFEVSQGLLEAYGIRVATTWPIHYPTLDDVIPALIELEEAPLLSREPLELSHIVQRRHIDETEVKIALADHDLFARTAPLFTLSCLLVMAACYFGVSALEDLPRVQVALGVFGTLLGLVGLFPILSIWRIQIKDLPPILKEKYSRQEFVRRRIHMSCTKSKLS